MPGRDGKGPLGEGPMTGGGFGFCGFGARVNNRNYNRAGMGFGRGGFGRGRRLMRNDFPPSAYNSVSPEDDKQILENDLSYLEEQMQEIKGRLKEMQKDVEK